MTAVSPTLRVLLVEDDCNDADLIAHELARGGLRAELKRVDNEAAYVRALDEEAWDVILSDHRLPAFNALRALELYRQRRLDLPFILVSGTLDDRAAIACMRAGAHDYLLKDRLARLVPVVRREWSIRTERRRAEERYRLLVENCNDLVTEITRSGEVRYSSPNHRLLLGLDPAQVVGQNIFERVHPDDRAVVLDLLNHEDRSSVVYRFLAADGTHHWLESSGRAFQASDGEERIVVISRDTTDKVKAEETRRGLEAQLRQSQKMEAIGTLAGGIAHDFNNILVGIIGNVQLAQFESTQNPRAALRLEEALKAGQRARDLVAQILTFSRQREQSPAIAPVGPVVSEALRLLRASLPATIEFVVDLDGATPAIRCDPSQIHQIVMNLATNAAYAMRERGGRLEVSLSRVCFEPGLTLPLPPVRASHGACLTISDTGCGMDPATQRRLFEPFFTTKPPGEGTGLGLAVVHGIVKSHDGAITVESAPGRGTTFRICFPAAEDAATAAAPPPDPAPRGHGEQLLLVDDEPSVTMIAELMLERLGYEVEAFSDPARAVEAFKRASASFHAVITDFTMPAMGGLDVAREVHAVRAGLPVLLMSGNLQVNDVARAKAAGICAIIEKPFSMQQLAQRLENALEAARKSA